MTRYLKLKLTKTEIRDSVMSKEPTDKSNNGEICDYWGTTNNAHHSAQCIDTKKGTLVTNKSNLDIELENIPNNIEIKEN